jgi:hypothetical protein
MNDFYWTPICVILVVFSNYYGLSSTNNANRHNNLIKVFR